MLSIKDLWELKKICERAGDKHGAGLVAKELHEFYADQRALELASDCVITFTSNSNDTDGYYEKYVLENSHMTRSEVEDWFFERHFMPEVDEPFAGYGQSYTVECRIFKVADKWVLYHRIGYDFY